MRKRTPQEIADFFGCYVARDVDRRWHIFKEKPELKLGYYRKENTFIKNGIYLNPELINADNVYDKVILYEPQKTISPESTVINEKSDENCQKDDLCPHQSEVHIGDRYVLLGEFHPSELMQKVEEYLNDGFKLYGNPFVGPDTNYGYIHYQAMVRGV